NSIVPRKELAAAAERPLQAERWAGAIDAVGGRILAGVLPQIRYNGSVAACGLAGGSDLQTTVFPFLLRGVNLLGIDSVMQPLPERESAWRRIAETLPADVFAGITQVAPLEELPQLTEKILNGQVRGRVVIKIGGEQPG